MPTNAKRRWYQLSLRTFFVLVALACVGLGWWVHRCKEWIRLRHEAFDTGMVSYGNLHDENDNTLAPGGLWLLGETGAGRLGCRPQDFQLAKYLFPEALIFPDSRSSR